MDVTKPPDADDAMDDPGGYGKDLAIWGFGTGIALSVALGIKNTVGDTIVGWGQSAVNALASEAGDQADTGFDFE